MKAFYEMHRNDQEIVVKSFRVSPQQFDHITSLLQVGISKDCEASQPITAAERLAVQMF